MERKRIQKITDLEVYNLSYSLAVEIFRLSKSFPKEELYSLTDQIRRSSRSVPANISEGFAKRHHTNIFKNHLLIAIGSSEETKTWLDFSKDFSYLNEEDHKLISSRYTHLGSKLYCLIQTWRSYQ
jgi:four helix bundle protein